MDWRITILVFLFGAVCSGTICLILFRRKQKKVIDSLQEMIAAAASGNLKLTNYEESQRSSLENDLYNYLSSTLVTAENLTEQKQVIQTLISDISHQCVTPIANILLYAQLLEEKDHQETREIKLISQQSKKLDFLIKALVKMSRLEIGTIVPVVKKQSVAPLLALVKKQFQTNLLEKAITLTIKESNESAIYDRKWTSEALSNILDNAIKYSPAGSNIQMTVESTPMFTKISVQDEGNGISEKDQNRIFQRFYRSEDVADLPGIGVGLYLARQIIEAQSGYIKLTSEMGQGSSFSLYLPTE
ncbi:sensor histidine kinase [Enterococcus sp. DIV0756]|uniref:sensor histidine kinase n=1 Tax=Enterococcus sp. DIV0756 TaxID=2774636 RepID=UPI003F21DD43